jgi:glycosyltransferase involved in cell wall biosynthesis
MKVLVSAYTCEPGRGSEEGVGWNRVQQAARFHDVWVLTQQEGRQGIKAALASEALPRVQFIFLDLPPWARFWKKGRRGAQLHYYLWQLAAYFVGRRLHRKVGFDLIHHVTLVKYWMPSFLGLLPVPFIWGPVGGGESPPRALRRCFSLRGRLYEVLRDLARKMGECDPFVRHTARKATLGLATTEDTAKRMRMLGCRRVSVHSEAGLPQEEIRRLSSIPPCQSSPFRLLSIGNLHHWKGFELGIRAFALFCREFPGSEYWLIGDGPERKRLRKLPQRLGVAGSVTFWGAIPRSQVLEKLGHCDVLVHPSLHDSGGWACLEAMAAGRPVICLDLGGPAFQVTEETGIKIPAIAPEQVVHDLAAAFYKLASDPGVRARLSLGARKRVQEHFDWDEKGLIMAKLYESLSATKEDMAVKGKLSA